MKYRVISAAMIEATESALWYEDQQSGLADEFYAELKSGLDRISENPMRMPLLEQYSGVHNVRRSLLKRFPYAIIFMITDSEVVVLAVAHTHRRPLYWLSRL